MLGAVLKLYACKVRDGTHKNCRNAPSAVGSLFTFFDGGPAVDAPLAAEDDADVGAD